MAEILCIRHGQASFATDDYDQLSKKGLIQGRLIGEHLARSGALFDTFYAGSLQRQQQTAEAVMAVYREQDLPVPDIQTDARWDELESEKQIQLLMPLILEEQPELADLLAVANTDKKAFQKLIRATFNYWVNHQPDIPGLESWPDARERVISALDSVCEHNGSGTRAAVFSSGGVIALLTAHILNVPASGVYPIFEQVINGSVTRLVHSSGRISLSSFNEHAFLRATALNSNETDVITYR